MHRVVLGEAVDEGRGAFAGFSIARILGIENPQWVVGQALSGVLAQNVDLGGEELAQTLTVGRACLGATQGVYRKLYPAEPQAPGQADKHGEHFGVAIGSGVAVELAPGLVKLAVAPALGLLCPK